MHSECLHISPGQKLSSFNVSYWKADRKEDEPPSGCGQEQITTVD